ncbi:hypothetical protein NPIL_93501 [Nephila pilipes]|uniref:Uncharacterized protein n=1 Tax=Nephila pilipes TaxID=299642 RepID=A0A8X6PPE9_NEPPI|nr:hypothetical protein NPIL_93501 [Nephila pilipes]
MLIIEEAINEGPRKLEPQSRYKDDIWADTLSLSFYPTLLEGLEIGRSYVMMRTQEHLPRSSNFHVTLDPYSFS